MKTKDDSKSVLFFKIIHCLWPALSVGLVMRNCYYLGKLNTCKENNRKKKYKRRSIECEKWIFTHIWTQLLSRLYWKNKCPLTLLEKGPRSLPLLIQPICTFFIPICTFFMIYSLISFLVSNKLIKKPKKDKMIMVRKFVAWGFLGNYISLLWG